MNDFPKLPLSIQTLILDTPAFTNKVVKLSDWPNNLTRIRFTDVRVDAVFPDPTPTLNSLILFTSRFHGSLTLKYKLNLYMMYSTFDSVSAWEMPSGCTFIQNIILDYSPALNLTSLCGTVSLYQIETAPEDCAKVVQIAEELHMPTVSPSKYERLKANCCQYNYFECENGRVTVISLYEANLYGTLNISLIPDSVTYFEIFDNQISKIVGKFNTLNLQSFVIESICPLFLHPNMRD
eukprot:NODE_139_length_16235_cov_0.569038.p8 type:complete len:237 gc:universal NODE_139_length_16235_cov_0.569038:165-875(+)